MRTNHLLLPHRWNVVSVEWGATGSWATGHFSTHPHTVARAVCTRPGCPGTKSKEFPGANLTVEAARMAW
jgi:hypothetical protein